MNNSYRVGMWICVLTFGLIGVEILGLFGHEIFLLINKGLTNKDDWVKFLGEIAVLWLFILGVRNLWKGGTYTRFYFAFVSFGFGAIPVLFAYVAWQAANGNFLIADRPEENEKAQQFGRQAWPWIAALGIPNLLATVLLLLPPVGAFLRGQREKSSPTQSPPQAGPT
jgi:hypothetical protein